MSGYAFESFRYFEIAEKAFNNFDDNKNAFVCIIFSAMFIEGIINDLIFSEKLNDKLIAEFRKIPIIDLYNFNLHSDKTSWYSKLIVVFEKYSFEDNEHKEYIEMKHLISIRNSLAHLKPLEQKSDGKSEYKISRKALNYLNKNIKIIQDPFDRGVFWMDTLMNKDVAEWSVNVAINFLEYLYNVTYVPPFGNSTLDFHLMKLKRGRWKNR